MANTIVALVVILVINKFTVYPHLLNQRFITLLDDSHGNADGIRLAARLAAALLSDIPEKIPPTS